MRGLGSRLWRGLASEVGCVSRGTPPTAMQRPGMAPAPLGWRQISSKQASPTEQSASKSKEQAAYLVRLGHFCRCMGLGWPWAAGAPLPGPDA